MSRYKYPNFLPALTPSSPIVDTNRTDVTYNFQAAAGKIGAGSTAENAGQSISITRTVGGTTENAAYTYDSLHLAPGSRWTYAPPAAKVLAALTN